jgi:hypothetical protein
MLRKLLYQNGLDWMRRPEEKWLRKKTVTPPPAEERRKDMVRAIPRMASTVDVATMQVPGRPRTGRLTRPELA